MTPRAFALAVIEADAPFRQMLVPGGATMSVAMTNTGRNLTFRKAGSDRRSL